MQDLWQLISGNAFLIVDTLLVAVGLYYLFLYVRGTKTAFLLQAFVSLVALYILCQFLRLMTLVFLLERILLIAPVAIIVVFAPEIRMLLERASRRSRLFEWLIRTEELSVERETPFVDVVVDAVGEWVLKSRGALIVIERREEVDPYIVFGTLLDAIPSVRLLTSMFDPGNPLHDGAVLVRDDRVHSAGNFLPISESTALSDELGTRHRAAIGLTERCDAVVVVTSEERAEISIAFNGRLARRLTVEQLSEQLRTLLDPNENFATIVPRAVYI